MAEVPPRRRAAERIKAQPTASSGAAFCVRTCDGRYFPAQTGNMQSSAEACKSFCPASETKIFFGSSIEAAVSKEGKPYSSLQNAFRYRKELISGCTCNGKDVVGLAAINLQEDKTLRQGDIVANAKGLEVVKRVDSGEVSFAKTPASSTKQVQALANNGI